MTVIWVIGLNDVISQAILFIKNLPSTDTVEPVLQTLVTPGWWQLLLCFFACSVLMIISLNAIEKNGFQGTVIGTLIMPYFSGFPNLSFAYLMAQKGSDGAVVLENCLVNNVTTLTIILAIPAMLWGLNLFKGKKTDDSETRVNRLSLVLSLMAMVFFGAAVFVVSKDGTIDTTDGMLLVGLFLFWQLYHVFDVLKNKTRSEAKIRPRICFDLAIVGLCAWGIFSSIDSLVEWVSSRETGIFSRDHLGVLSGMTANTRGVELPELPAGRPVGVEAYAYHADLLDDRRELYDPSTLARIEPGAEVSAVDYAEALYQLKLARKAIARVFEDVDLLVTPTLPVLPIGIEEARESPAEATGSLIRNTAPFNSYGIPAITVPCGFSREGLPIGLQIVGPALGEVDVLALAHAYEQATEWHLRTPSL